MNMGEDSEINLVAQYKNVIALFKSRSWSNLLQTPRSAT